MGRVEDGNTASDFEPEEVKKGISVSLGMAPVEWAGLKINVLDAPGYADFIGDVRSAIRAVDAVLLVVSGVDGVEVQTEVAWEAAVEAGLPRAILINKLDRERASFERTLDDLVLAFGNQVAPLELPLGEEHDFNGVADLLTKKAYRYGAGPMAEEGEWPDDIAGKAAPFREKLMEAVAESDDALIEKYLEEGELPETEVLHGVKEGFARATIAPVLCGAASRPIGVDRVLQFITDEFPAPTERRSITVVSKSGEELERACTPD
jgi:elongation factor G